MGITLALTLGCGRADRQMSFPLGEPAMVEHEHPIDRLNWMRGTWRATSAKDQPFYVRFWQNGFALERGVSEDSIGGSWRWGGTFSWRGSRLEFSYGIGRSVVVTNAQGDSIGHGIADDFFHYVETHRQDGWIRFEETLGPAPHSYFAYRRASDSTMVFTSDEGEYTLTRIGE